MGTAFEPTQMETLVNTVMPTEETEEQIFDIPPEAQEARAFDEEAAERRRERIRRRALGTQQLQIPLTAPATSTGDVPTGDIRI